MKDMNQKRIKLLEDYLFMGGIVKMRGSIFVRYSQRGLYEVYANLLNSEAPKSTKLVKSDKIEKQKRKDEIYQHLIAINQNAKHSRGLGSSNH